MIVLLTVNFLVCLCPYTRAVPRAFRMQSVLKLNLYIQVRTTKWRLKRVQVFLHHLSLAYLPQLFSCKPTYSQLCVCFCLCLCRYRLAGLPGDYQEKNISSPETNYCLLKDLIIWTQYQIQVAAFTGAGLGVYSSPVTEYTLQGGELRHTHIFISPSWGQNKCTKTFWDIMSMHTHISLNLKYSGINM